MTQPEPIPEPIPDSVLRARARIMVSVDSGEGNRRQVRAEIHEFLMALRAETIEETIRKLVHEAVAPCPECDRVEQERLSYVGRP